MGRLALWEKALEDWNVRESQIAARWKDEGKLEQRLERNLRHIRSLGHQRFGVPSTKITRQLQAIPDADRLDCTHDALLTVEIWGELLVIP